MSIYTAAKQWTIASSNYIVTFDVHKNNNATIAVLAIVLLLLYCCCWYHYFILAHWLQYLQYIYLYHYVELIHEITVLVDKTSWNPKYPKQAGWHNLDLVCNRIKHLVVWSSRWSCRWVSYKYLNQFKRPSSSRSSQFYHPKGWQTHRIMLIVLSAPTNIIIRKMWSQIGV